MKDSVKNPRCLTMWSIIHFIVGFSTALLLKNLKFMNGFIIYNIIHFLYELKDYLVSNIDVIRNFAKKTPILDWSTDNSLLNCVCDQAVSAVGFVAGYYFFNKYFKNISYIYGLTLLLVTSIIAFLFSKFEFY